jgi:hypothetical protein
LALTFLPLATGAALVVYIISGISLGTATIALLIVGIVTWALVLWRLDPGVRHWLASRVKIGALAGVPAVLAYDTVRWGIVALASWSFEPFHALPLFGMAILGPETDLFSATIVGIGFHLVNGIGFAIAYAIVFRRPSIKTGIAWAMVLEAAMLLLYPRWLGVDLFGELMPVSLAGHLAYGGMLGAVTRRLGRPANERPLTQSSSAR